MLTEAFGTLAVSVMAIAYGLEKRSPSFVLGFAAGCAASSLYAVLIRAWPFAVLEFLALRRWFHQMREPDTVAKETDRISACHAGEPWRADVAEAERRRSTQRRLAGTTLALSGREVTGQRRVG